MGFKKKLPYAKRVLPPITRQALRSPVSGPVHLILALADHFEPAFDPTSGYKRVPRPEQVRREEAWFREYPKAIENLRDHDGRALVHTYFYPAEQYDEELVEMLAEHCHAGWGETEIHLHHGMHEPDTAENTRRQLTEFRDQLAFRHRCLSTEDGSPDPRYAFVHGNFALANSAGGLFCGVDSEMQILAETGCYADLTMPAALWHPAQTAKVNSVYECELPLDQVAPQRKGRDLAVGRAPKTWPLIVQGPLLTDFAGSFRSLKPVVENGAITGFTPMSLRRLAFWKKARVHVAGRPDWLFIKLHCHSMDPTYREAVIGGAFLAFLDQLVNDAAGRKETLHFVTAREMVNILLAACDGRDGSPGEYRDYRFKRMTAVPPAKSADSSPEQARPLSQREAIVRS
ncbi:MAG: hypothetical protein WA213_02050 [Terriglobales bacterium]